MKIVNTNNSLSVTIKLLQFEKIFLDPFPSVLRNVVMAFKLELFSVVYLLKRESKKSKTTIVIHLDISKLSRIVPVNKRSVTGNGLVAHGEK